MPWVPAGQQKAGIHIHGNSVHRGRDTFVEKQFSAGVPIAVVAARLGDLVSTVEHLASDDAGELESARRQPVGRV